MKHKPDAYEIEFTGRGDDRVKCENCGFKCVYCQILDNGGKCPRCQSGKEVVKGKLKK